MAYLLDANVFTQAQNLHYGLDFCPAFWNWLIEANAAGKVLCIEKVGDEIDAGADELASWAAARGAHGLDGVGRHNRGVLTDHPSLESPHF